MLVGRNPFGLQGLEAPQSIRFAFGTVVVLMSLSLPPFVSVLEADCGFIRECILRIRLEILLPNEKWVTVLSCSRGSDTTRSCAWCCDVLGCFYDQLGLSDYLHGLLAS